MMTTMHDDPEVAAEAAEPPPVDPDGATDAAPAEPRRRIRRVTAATAVLALIGVGVLALGGVTHYQAQHDDDLAAATARDAALVAASTEIATLNTLDYRDVDGGIQDWLDATTGTLHDQLSQAGDSETKLLADQQKITTGKVVGKALTALDAAAGTATAIASVEITVQGTTGEPTLKRNRFSADLVRTRDGWKLETLTQVAVDIS